MATLDDVYKQRWQALTDAADYVPENGIPTYWRQTPSLGSPLGPETPLDNGGVAQAFAGGVVIWDPDQGARLATE